jgi:hypothetical protein
MNNERANEVVELIRQMSFEDRGEYTTAVLRDAADELERLREGVKPFAALAARTHPRTMEEPVCVATINPDDLKRAAEVLK